MRGYRRPGVGGDALLKKEVVADTHRHVGGSMPHNAGVLRRIPLASVRGTAGLSPPRGLVDIFKQREWALTSRAD